MGQISANSGEASEAFCNFLLQVVQVAWEGDVEHEALGRPLQDMQPQDCIEKVVREFGLAPNPITYSPPNTVTYSLHATEDGVQFLSNISYPDFLGI